MPTNLYGPRDNYHPENSHVIPAMILRFHEAKMKNLPSVTIWGTRTPRREFLYVNDMVRACTHVMNLEKSIYEKHLDLMCSHINVGAGEDLTIKKLAETVKDAVGYQGEIELDPDKPNGSPRKLMDSRRLTNFGWKPEVALKEGLIKSYKLFLKHKDKS
tara:strand:- start:188 stop:664 length:477 start_codon:yes stop_codon:yes gene_type:complete